MESLPDPYSAVEGVRQLVEFLESLAGECAGRGRPSRYQRTDDIKRQLIELATGVMPCLRHAGAHGSEVCRLGRRAVAEAAWDLEEIAKRKGAPVTPFRGKSELWPQLDNGISVARGALQLAVAVALAQETAGEGWVDALIGLARNGGRPQGKSQVLTARELANFWSVSRQGDLEHRLWDLHDRLRANIIVPPESALTDVSRGPRRGASKQHVEALRKLETRKVERLRVSESPEKRLSSGTEAEQRLRELLGGDPAPGEWYVRVISKARYWEWLNLYIGFLTAASDDAATENEARRQAKEEAEGRDAFPEVPEIPKDSKKQWDGFHMTKHGRRGREAGTQPDSAEP